MELRNVKTFIKVAELENFSKAAAALGYAQSTVTSQIKMLEEELQVQLFERHGKRVSLSNAGLEFLNYAYQLQKCEAMALEHFSSRDEPEGTLSIGVMETICASYYAQIFTAYMKKYPKVELKTVVATTLECMDQLEQGRLDMILTVDREIHRPDWETAYEIPTEISFFCSSRHPFAEKKEVTLDELVKENFILIEAGCNYREAFEQYVQQKGKRLSQVMELGYTRLIIDGVTENLGVSLLPKFTLENEIRQKKISRFHLKGYRNPMSMQLIYSKNRWVSPAMRKFSELAKQYLY